MLGCFLSIALWCRLDHVMMHIHTWGSEQGECIVKYRPLLQPASSRPCTTVLAVTSFKCFVFMHIARKTTSHPHLCVCHVCLHAVTWRRKKKKKMWWILCHFWYSRHHWGEISNDYIVEEHFKTFFFLAGTVQLLLLSTALTMKGPHGVLNAGTSLTAQRETAATLHHLDKDEKQYCTHGKK